MVNSSIQPKNEEPARSKLAVGIGTGIVVAVVTAAVGYVVTFVDQHRKDQVQFVSAQIEKLYGPLFALSQANDVAWAHFHQGYWKDRETFFQEGQRLNANDIELWRRWMSSVFQPLNVKMEDVIVNNMNLFVGEKIPAMFLQFVSHVESYKAVISRWKPEDSKDLEKYAEPQENLPVVLFPKQPDFSRCIADQFHLLKSLQQDLQNELIGSLSPLQEKTPETCG